MTRMAIYLCLAYFTMIIITTVYSSDIVKISTGVHLEPIPKKFYESSTNLVYEIPIPTTTNFLSRHKCVGSDCVVYNHIQQLLNDTLSLLSHTLPSAPDLPPGKHRRALNFVADIGNWCCGFATAGQIDTLSQTDSDLSKIINSLKNQVIREHDAAVQSRTLINEYSHHMQQTVSEFKNVTIENLDRVASLNDNLEIEIENLEDNVSLLSKVLHHTVISLMWSRILNDCTHRKIPIAVINSTVLTDDLSSLVRSLDPHQQQLTIPINNVHDYYLLDTTTCYFSSSQLTIRVQIPIISKINHYELFAVTAIPFYYNGSLCQLILDTDYIIYKNKRTIVPVNGHERDQCIPLHSKLCYVSRYMIPIHSQQCLSETILNHRTVNALKAFCRFSCALLDTTVPYIIQFSPLKFGVILHTGELIIRCNNETDIIHNVENPVGILEILLKCHCVAIVPNHPPITPDWPCLQDPESDVYLRHLLPASWTIRLEQNVLSPHSFFTNATSLISHDWPNHIPYTNLSSPLLHEFVLPEHVHVTSYLIYIVSIITIIVVIVIIIVLWKLGGTSAALTAIYSQLYTPVATLPIENTTTIDFYFESAHLFCLIVLTLFVILIYLKLKTSPFLKILSTNSNWTRGRHRVTLTNDNQPTAPSLNLEHSFTTTAPSGTRPPSSFFPSSHK